MFSRTFARASKIEGQRRRMRFERAEERRLALRHRWYGGGIAALLAGSLVFSGMSPAVAEEVTTDPAASSETMESTDAATDATGDEQTDAGEGEPATPTEPTDAEGSGTESGTGDDESATGDGQTGDAETETGETGEGETEVEVEVEETVPLSARVAPLADDAITPMAILACAGWPVANVAGFEIDGNLCLDGAGTKDWATVGGQPVSSDGYDDSTSFTNGSSEDDWPDWGLITKIGGPQQDIGNVYAYTQTVDGRVYAYMGYERGATNGTIAYYVELNQQDNLNGPIPDRTAGDLRLVIYQNGNETISLSRADRWNGSTWVALGSLDGFVGQINQGEIENLAGEVFESGAFAEIAIDLTALFESSGCSGSYGVLNVRSNASVNETSAMKDWIAPIDLNVPSTCGTLEILKTNAAGDPLEGATFEISPDPADGVGTATAVTNAAGEIVFPGIEPGQYTITETIAPAGYLLASPASQQVTIGDAETKAVTFVDPLGSVRWIKHDRAGALLGGATFQVTATGGAASGPGWELDANPITVVDNGPNDADPDLGEFQVVDLPTGTYSVVETAAPAGYVLDPTAQNATVSQATPNPSIALPFVNTPYATVTLTKDWVNSFDGDTAELSIDGGDVSDAATSTAPTDGPVISVKVAPGATVDLAEVLGDDNRGLYTSVLDCGALEVADNTGVSGSVTVPAWPASADGVDCTFTNTAETRDITLQKEWIDAFQGDSAALSLTGDADGATSVANGQAGSWTDEGNVATATVRVGETVAFGEVLTASSGAQYSTTFSCDPTLDVTPGDTVTAYTLERMPDHDVVCTFTNTAEKATVTLKKEWKNAFEGDIAELGIDGPGVNDSSADAVAPEGDGTSAEFAQVEVRIGDKVILSEVLPDANTGEYSTSWNCTPNAEITVTGNLVCIVTNTADTVDIRVDKTWIDAFEGDAADLSITGTTNTATADGTTPQTIAEVVVKTVRVGDGVTVTETLDVENTGTYDTLIDCTVVDELVVARTATFTAPATDVICTYTNTAVRHLVTLQKEWVNAFAGDTTTLSAGDETAESEASGISGSEIDVDNQVTVSVREGDSIDLAESAITGTGTYSTTYSCNDADAQPGTSFTLDVDGEAVLCTFTNTAQGATVTLQKEWIDAFDGDEAALVIDGAGASGDTATSTADGTDGVDEQNVAELTVRLGEVVNLSETIDDAENTGRYDSSWACDDQSAGPGRIIDAITVEGDIVCTITNEARSIDITVDKVWVDAFEGDTATLSIDDDSAPAVADGTALQTIEDVVVSTVRVGSDVTVAEVLGDTKGAYNTTAECTGVDELLSADSRTATFAASDDDITCTFTNEARTHSVTLLKEWVDALTDDSAALEIAAGDGGVLYGGTPTATSTVTDETGPSFTDVDNVATTAVRVGDTVTLSETVDGVGTYASEYLCTDAETLSGTTRSFDLTMPDEAVTCTFTNTAARATVTLQKEWVGAFAGDGANLSITGDATDAQTSVASGTDGIDDTVATVSVRLGERVSLSESITDADNQGRYDSSWVCDDGSEGTGRTIGDITVTENLVCTVTNTARTIDVTVDKRWIDAFAGDTALLWIDGDSEESTATGAGIQLDQSVATAVVRVGETVQISETIDDASNTGVYGSTYACEGVSEQGSGRALDFVAPDADVVCTFTNTAQRVDVFLGKRWINAVDLDSTTLSATPEAGAILTALSTYEPGMARDHIDELNVVRLNVRIGATIPMFEQINGVGSYQSSFQCTGGEQTPIGDDGRAFTLRVTQGGILCRFANEAESATVHLTKTWVNGQNGDTADLTISGQTVETATSTSNGQVGSWTDLDNEVTAEALIGTEVTVSELIEVVNGAASDYTSSLVCTTAAADVLTVDARTGSFTMPSVPVWCEFTNTAELPTLSLLKMVAGADVAETNWQLTATPDEGEIVTDPAGGDVAATEVPTDTAYALTEALLTEFAGSDEFEAGEWACANADGAIAVSDSVPGSATLGGLDKGEDVVCMIVNSHIDQGFTVDKEVVDSVQNDEGGWSVTYEVTAHNNSVVVPIEYDLFDTLDTPQDGVIYTAASWTGATTGEFDLASSLTAQLAGGEVLAPFDGTNDAVYTVVVDVEVASVPADAAACDEGAGGIGVVNTVEMVVGDGEPVGDEACGTVHYDDVDIVKSASNLPAEGAVEPGDTFDYVLTVTNNGTRDAVDVVVTDPIAERLEVTAVGLPTGWVNDNGDALVDGDNALQVSTPLLGVGESADITVTVTFLPTEVAPVAPGDDTVQPATPLDELVNTACVDAERDQVEENNCSTTEIPVREITATVYTTCVADAPFLGWTITKSPALIDEEIQFLWTPDTASATTDPAQVALTHPGGTATWSEEIEWPGAAFTPSGVSIDYPGWRPIQIGDVVPGSIPTQYYYPGTTEVIPADSQGDYVFNGLILDDSELDYAWRLGSTVTFTVNPELVFSTAYPPATPECVVARHSDVQIEKSASVEKTDPGSSFEYTLEVGNVSDDAAAESVVVTDEIPADIKITDVTWVGEGDDTVFPNWQTCEVSGTDAEGYGGTLECVLYGPLQPLGAEGTSTAPTIILAATVDPMSTSSSITNVAVVDYHTFGDPDDPGRDSDDAIVLLSALPATGGTAATPLAILGLLALLAGATTMVIARRRRGERAGQL